MVSQSGSGYTVMEENCWRGDHSLCHTTTKPEMSEPYLPPLPPPGQCTEEIKAHFRCHLKIKIQTLVKRVEMDRIHDAWGVVWSFICQRGFDEPLRLLVMVHCVSSGPRSVSCHLGDFRALLKVHTWPEPHMLDAEFGTDADLTFHNS